MVGVTDIETKCCIAGGGPAGIMLGYLLALQGVDVVVLEKWPDFFRDFRGDTIHQSTLQILKELGLLDDFLKLVVTECYYCGDEPSHISNFKKLNGQFVYHGIDRVDNNIGYTLENSVSSCWPCNRAKSTMTTSEFLIMIKKIHDKHIK